MYVTRDVVYKVKALCVHSCIGDSKIPLRKIGAIFQSSNNIQLDALIAGPDLVTLILKCKGIAKANPGSCKAVLYGRGFAKIASGAVILLGTQVIAANSKPGQRTVWVLLYKSAHQAAQDGVSASGTAKTCNGSGWHLDR